MFGGSGAVAYANWERMGLVKSRGIANRHLRFWRRGFCSRCRVRDSRVRAPITPSGSSVVEKWYSLSNGISSGMNTESAPPLTISVLGVGQVPSGMAAYCAPLALGVGQCCCSTGAGTIHGEDVKLAGLEVEDSPGAVLGGQEFRR